MKRTVLMLLAMTSAALGQGVPRSVPHRLPPEIAAAAIEVTGLSATAVTLTVADLAKLPPQTVQVTDRGNTVTFEGVLLFDLLSKVKTPTGEGFHNTAASYYLVADAQDGYKAVFGWAEIDPSFTDRKIFVVTRRDGKPLPEREGPFELVVPGEKRNGRWVRQLKSLRIQPVPTASAYDSREVHRKCGYIKVGVAFAPSGDPPSGDPHDDRITSISKSFLEWPIGD